MNGPAAFTRDTADAFWDVLLRADRSKLSQVEIAERLGNCHDGYALRVTLFVSGTSRQGTPIGLSDAYRLADNQPVARDIAGTVITVDGGVRAAISSEGTK